MNDCQPCRGDFKHSYNRRCKNHDYRSRCIYMITILKSKKSPCLSRITRDPKIRKISPLVEILPAGKIIQKCLEQMCRNYPALRILCSVVMPDHIHFELFVTERTELALGSMIAAFKSACSNQFHANFPDSPVTREGLSLFETGFNDKIVFRAGAKDAFYNYIIDNPRRYLVKKLCPEYFYHRLQIIVNGKPCGLYGNIFLLDHPVKSFVKLSRDPQKTPGYEAKIREFEETIRCGGVLVSPFINPYEKEYRDKAIENGNGIILITDCRFSERKKPYGELFDRCAEGRLLIVSTEEYAESPKAMNYRHAQELNVIASDIAQLAPLNARLKLCSQS